MTNNLSYGYNKRRWTTTKVSQIAFVGYFRPRNVFGKHSEEIEVLERINTFPQCGVVRKVKIAKQTNLMNFI